MQQAVKTARILDKRQRVADTILTFVSEPEAAALATLKHVDGRCDVKSGDSFVVCDCGGGTADLITYLVKTVEPMTICEIVKGAGALAGAVFVDARFKLLLKKKLDELQPGLWEHISAEDLEEIMSNDWHMIRNKFIGSPAQGFTVRVPTSLYEADLLDIRDGIQKLQITSMDLKEVFQPVLEKIEALICGQVDSAVAKRGQKPKVSRKLAALAAFSREANPVTVHHSRRRIR